MLNHSLEVLPLWSYAVDRHDRLDCTDSREAKPDERGEETEKGCDYNLLDMR